MPVTKSALMGGGVGMVVSSCVYLQMPAVFRGILFFTLLGAALGGFVSWRASNVGARTRRTVGKVLIAKGLVLATGTLMIPGVALSTPWGSFVGAKQTDVVSIAALATCALCTLIGARLLTHDP